MIDRNPQYRALAHAVGPWAPETWPTPAYSGTTGGHTGYGWSHADLMTYERTVAAIQSAAARDIHFTDAPSRGSGYDDGGLPPGYHAIDHETLVIDAEHLFGAVCPLLAVYDAATHYITTPGGEVHGNTVAAALLRSLGAAHAGMLRKPDGKQIAWTFSERASAGFVRTLYELGRRNLLSKQDAATIKDYIDTRLVPWWLTPDHIEGGGSKGDEGGNSRQVYNGMDWLGPALYDLMLATLPGKDRRDYLAVLRVMAAKVGLLYQEGGAAAIGTDRVARWSGLNAEDVTTATYYEPWGIRMWDVAATLGGPPELHAVALQAAVKHRKASPEWCYNAGGKALGG